MDELLITCGIPPKEHIRFFMYIACSYLLKGNRPYVDLFAALTEVGSLLKSNTNLHQAYLLCTLPHNLIKLDHFFVANAAFIIFCLIFTAWRSFDYSLLEIY